MPATITSTIINQDLLHQLQQAFTKIDGYGSIEIYVQKNRVTQITTRNIVKTDKPVVKTNN